MGDPSVGNSVIYDHTNLPPAQNFNWGDTDTRLSFRAMYQYHSRVRNIPADHNFQYIPAAGTAATIYDITSADEQQADL